MKCTGGETVCTLSRGNRHYCNSDPCWAEAAGTGRERTKKLTDGQAGRFSATRSDAGLRCALPFSARYASPLLPPVAMRVYRGLESAPGSAAW